MGSTGMAELKERIRAHYDVCSTYYHSLWGEHVHHGYWTPETTDISKEDAQVALIRLLLRVADLPASSEPSEAEPKRLRVLDVGCGLGGTSRFLAKEMGWDITGVTISGEQVMMAKKLSQQAAKGAELNGATTDGHGATNADDSSESESDRIPLGAGSVRFLVLDAELIGTTFPAGSFDVVWICEALSHFPFKPTFFASAAQLLRPGGKLVVADWFKHETASEDEIRPIEDGMLLPPLSTMEEYTRMAEKAGLQPASTPDETCGPSNWKDISKEVARTWDISLDLVASPSLWAFAFSQGRDFVGFLKAFQAMRTGFASGSFRYGVAAFAKPLEN